MTTPGATRRSTRRRSSSSGLIHVPTSPIGTPPALAPVAAQQAPVPQSTSLSSRAVADVREACAALALATQRIGDAAYPPQPCTAWMPPEEIDAHYSTPLRLFQMQRLDGGEALGQVMSQAAATAEAQALVAVLARASGTRASAADALQTAEEFLHGSPSSASSASGSASGSASASASGSASSASSASASSTGPTGPAVPAGRGAKSAATSAAGSCLPRRRVFSWAVLALGALCAALAELDSENVQTPSLLAVEARAWRDAHEAWLRPLGGTVKSEKP